METETTLSHVPPFNTGALPALKESVATAAQDTSTMESEASPPPVSKADDPPDELNLEHFFMITPPSSLITRPEITQSDSSQELLSTKQTTRHRKPLQSASQPECKAAGVRTKTSPGVLPTSSKNGKVTKKATNRTTVNKATLARTGQVLNRHSTLETLHSDDS